ncbi:MAG: hypothetical protein B193_3999 [Solidesulfovibrio magneticus str. Maddingley MBC34]|uniref:Uncharacterized protein n=1 Tax=Solidesulfovibrio magneticus str. Maddingley MBC34 TaxID=1206767 RepID=K6G896_9BACT|nr:MAG: hypothetical protein B193_3999 [Solidesulfovibrio magneticus str. Maddingley MBC34]
MKRLFPIFLIAALAWAGLPGRAAAFDEQSVMICAFRQALAMLTCKTPDKYSFVGVRDGVYVFNSHFAKGFADFYVQLNGDLAIFSSRVWHGRMPSGRIVKDYAAGCVQIIIDPLPCSSFHTARCCGSQ